MSATEKLREGIGILELGELHSVIRRHSIWAHGSAGAAWAVSGLLHTGGVGNGGWALTPAVVGKAGVTKTLERFELLRGEALHVLMHGSWILHRRANRWAVSILLHTIFHITILHISLFMLRLVKLLGELFVMLHHLKLHQIQSSSAWHSIRQRASWRGTGIMFFDSDRFFTWCMGSIAGILLHEDDFAVAGNISIVRVVVRNAGLLLLNLETRSNFRFTQNLEIAWNYYSFASYLSFKSKIRLSLH
jgi:hypothetical protein